MGLLEVLKENREKNKLFKQERQAKNEIARAKAQAAYDIEFQKGAVEAVKERAKREATERFGYSKRERRAKAMESFAKGMGGLGDLGANMGNDIFGSGPSQKVVHHHHHHTTKSRSHKHTHHKHRTTHRQQKQKDPFDFSDLGF